MFRRFYSSAFACSLVIAAAAVPAAPAAADTLVGVQGLAVAGHHYDPGNNLQGAGGGALIEIRQRWKTVRLHLEGVPVIDTAHADSPRYGRLTQSFGMFNAVASVRLDRRGQYWAGVGSGIVAQRTPYINYPYPGWDQVNASRLAGTRYQVDGVWQTGGAAFFEVAIAAMPHMRGTDYLTVDYPGGHFERSKGENAAMTDLSASYGVRRGSMQYALGLRLINFSANFTDGHAADRNVGAGPTFEARLSL